MASDVELSYLPRHVHIGARRYEIVTDGEGAYDYGFWGVCKNRSARIALDPMQPDAALRQTLVHEILHAIGQMYEIPMVAYHTHDTNDKVTDKIDALAHALLLFMRDNPAVVNYITAARVPRGNAPTGQTEATG